MKQLIISVIFTALLTATSFLCLADNQSHEIVGSVLPPTYPFKVMPTPTYKAPLASTLKLGTFVIQLESTSLTEVLDTIKVGHIGHRGDAAESVTWLCYSIHDAANPFRIWLMSGEIDGGKVGSIVARTISVDENTTQSCPNLPTVYMPIKLEHDVWIATDENTTRKTLGNPSLAINEWLSYESERNLSLHGEEFTEVGTISMRFKNGRIVEIWVSKTTSN